MKAVVFDADLTVAEVPMPEPAQGESLVGVTLAGVCNTDVEITRGYMAFRGILGHEFTGVVLEGPDPDLQGRRVVGEINIGCGACAACGSGMQRHCPNRAVLGILNRNGAMAEYVALPTANLVAVPDEVPDEKAVFTEPLAAALEILEQVHISPSDRVLVIGDGKLGLLVGMVLRLLGCSVTLAGKHPPKLAVFTRLGGLTVQPDNLATNKHLFDLVVEASGNPSGWGLALRQVRARGTIVLKSTFHGGMDFNPAAAVVNEITVVGSRCGRFEPALRLMALGLVDPTPLISAVNSLDNAVEAFRRSQDPDTLKILLRIP